MKKKVDSRIRTLIENGVAQRHRTFIVLVGDKGKDQVRVLGLASPAVQRAARAHLPHASQVVNLHYILSKSAVKARPSVLWCYKKELELSR